MEVRRLAPEVRDLRSGHVKFLELQDGERAVQTLRRQLKFRIGYDQILVLLQRWVECCMFRSYSVLVERERVH